MDHIVTAVFTPGTTETVAQDALYQWAYGQTLRLEGIELPEAYQVDFSNFEFCGESIPRVGGADGVSVPVEVLRSGSPVYAFFWAIDQTSGRTWYRVEIRVIPRPVPDLDTPSTEEESAIAEAIAALNDGVDAAEAQAVLAESWAVGGTGTREGEDTNNAKYWAEQAQGGGGGEGLSDDVKQALLQLAQKVAYIDAHGSDYYQNLYDALYPSTPIELTGITATFAQGTHAIFDTDSLDDLKPYLTVTANYSDSSSATVIVYTLSGTLTAGTSTITVTYQGKTATFTVTVSQTPVMTGITATFNQGSATIYDTDSLDSLKTYLTVTATYTNGSTATVPSADYTLSGTLAEGTSTITVSYGGKTDTFTVTVSASHTPLWTFENGIMALIGSGGTAGKAYRQRTAARACGPAPIANNGYIFTVTDSSKYNVVAAGVNSMEQIPVSASSAIDGYGYAASNDPFAWGTSASVTAPYVWLSLKKMDGTAFTDEELADGASAVFSYTEGN